MKIHIRYGQLDLLISEPLSQGPLSLHELILLASNNMAAFESENSGKQLKSAKSIIYKILERGIEIKNQYSYISVIFGLWNLFLNKIDDANKYFCEALVVDPSNIFAVSLLGDLYRQDSGFIRWTQQRINELKMWNGKEDYILVGDSHVYSFIGVARCKIKYIGSHTMHRVGDSWFGGITKEIDDVKKYQNVVFSFGEIDARIHVKKQSIAQKLTMESIIDDVVDAYIKRILSEFSQDFTGRIGILGIVPPIKREHISDDMVFGSDEDRLFIHKHINHRLSIGADRAGFKYIDMYDVFRDQHGYISHGFWAGDHHISARHYRKLEGILTHPFDEDFSIPGTR